MPKNRNSASRLLALLTSFPAHADNTQTLAVWSALFNLQEPNTHRLSRVVADRLTTMNRELDLVRVGMDQAGFSEGLYTSALSAFEAALSPMQLPNTWNGVRQHLTAENLLALGFCGEILPDEESEIAQEELDEIRSLVDELNLLLANSTLPLRLQAVLSHHVELMLQALAEYPIAGAKALREAARTGLGELIEVRDIIVEHQTSKEVSILGEAWKKVNKAADLALKADKLFQLGHKAWEFLSGVWPN